MALACEIFLNGSLREVLRYTGNIMTANILGTQCVTVVVVVVIVVVVVVVVDKPVKLDTFVAICCDLSKILGCFIRESGLFLKGFGYLWLVISIHI